MTSVVDAVAEVYPAAVIAAAIAKTNKLLNMGFLFIPSPQQIIELENFVTRECRAGTLLSSENSASDSYGK